MVVGALLWALLLSPLLLSQPAASSTPDTLACEITGINAPPQVELGQKFDVTIFVRIHVPGELMSKTDGWLGVSFLVRSEPGMHFGDAFYRAKLPTDYEPGKAGEFVAFGTVALHAPDKEGVWSLVAGVGVTLREAGSDSTLHVAGDSEAFQVRVVSESLKTLMLIPESLTEFPPFYYRIAPYLAVAAVALFYVAWRRRKLKGKLS
jgi:hypothetical protein